MNFLRSFSFRLAATYVILFAASLALLLGTFHLVSIAAPRERVKKELTAESDAFARAYRAGDMQVLAAALELRAAKPSPAAAFHLLADPNGRIVTTNLPTWPRFIGPRMVSIEADVHHDGDEDDYQALSFDRMLPDGSRLILGRDVDEIDDLEEAITDAAIYLVGGAIILAMLVALAMTRSIGRRIEMVNSAARQVISGDLSRRVQIDGSGDEFDRLSITLNLMLERVEAGVDSIRRVTDSVAHELRTPLTRLQANLHSLRDAGTGRDHGALARAIDEADHLQMIFDAVLRIARIESGRHGAKSQKLDLGAMLADAVDLYGPAADEKSIKLSSEIQPDLTIEGDRDLLFQAISNLIDNAIKFTPAGGTIAITGKRDNDDALLTIADTGPGIAAELIARVGERFFRAPSSAGVPGFGLGLSLANAVAELHQSTILLKQADPGLLVEWRLHRPEGKKSTWPDGPRARA